MQSILRLGRAEPEVLNPCSVHDLIGDTVELVRLQLERGGIELEVRSDAVADVVLGSGEELKGVLLNLVRNAADAMPGGGRLRILTHNTMMRDLRPAIMIHLIDEGPGVAPELRESIFDPFFTTKRDGSGLGLPLALRSIRHFGGNLYYEKASEIERGAEFVIVLPLLDPAAADTLVTEMVMAGTATTGTGDSRSI